MDTWLFVKWQQKEQDLVLENAQKANVRVAWQSNNEEFHCMQLHPRDMGGAFLRLIGMYRVTFSEVGIRLAEQVGKRTIILAVSFGLQR